MSDCDVQKALECLQEAVDLELERKARLGYKAVVCDSQRQPKIVSAKYLVRQRRAQKRQEALAASKAGATAPEYEE